MPADQEWLDLIRKAQEDGAPEWLLALLRELRGESDPFLLETYRQLLMDWARNYSPALAGLIAKLTSWLLRHPATVVAEGAAGGAAASGEAAAGGETAAGGAAAETEAATGAAAAGGTGTAGVIATGLIASLAWFAGLALAGSKLGELGVQWKSPCQEQYEDLIRLWATYEIDRDTNQTGTRRQKAMRNLGKASDIIGRCDGALLRCSDKARDAVVRRIRDRAEADRDKWLDVISH